MPNPVPRPPPTDRQLIGYAVGRYWKGRKNRQEVLVADYVAIDDHIQLVIEQISPLLDMRQTLFVPHLNTHHFETKTDGIPESIFQAFDRIILRRCTDYLYACSNWRESSGGIQEIQLAVQLGIPVFESKSELENWLSGKPYSRVTFDGFAEIPPDEDMKICLIDGPFLANTQLPKDVHLVHKRERVAEAHARMLWQDGIPCLTGPMNSSYMRTCRRMGDAQYDAFMRTMIQKLVSCVLVLPGWDNEPEVRVRAQFAKECGVPVFQRTEDVVSFAKDGTTTLQEVILTFAPRPQ